jgi:hypothetical protein
MHGCDLQRCFVSHGGLTPPALVAERTFAGEKTIFAMHERTFTRAAGVSPPWYRKTHLQRRVIFVEWLRLPLHNRLRLHGGLTPPALGPVTTTVGRKNDDFCDAETHMHKSGGRQPPVGMSNAIAIADAFVKRLALARRWSETTVATATRWISAFRVCIPNISHGGLTPPALGARCPVGEQMTIFVVHERTFTRAAGVSLPWVW